MTELAKGVYRHYKGGMYEVLDVATHSETLAKFVVYRALYGDMGTWVRPLEMFAESVTTDDGEVPRFMKVDNSNQ